MVTGDNILTAISVARQCRIIEQNTNVYLGEKNKKKGDLEGGIIWKDFDFNENKLDLNLK